MDRKNSKFMELYGYDLILGSIASFYVFFVPYTKVEESFNVQAMHDILYHQHHLENYDHLEFPGVVPRTFIGSLLVSVLAFPVTSVISCLHLPKIYSLYAVRLGLGFMTLLMLRFFRLQIKHKFGRQVEFFFVILTSVQFHMLFYCTRPLPNIFALGLVNLAYGYWLQGSFYGALNSLIVATLIFRCDILLLLAPLGLELLLNRSVSLWKALNLCSLTAFLCIGLTILVDSVMWRRLLWPEFEVLWFNSVLNRSSEWGTHPFHWYFTSALPRSLLAAYPLSLLGAFIDRRLLPYMLPIWSFVVLYSKLPHKELRFIIGVIPMLNLSGATAASRIFNNRKKGSWIFLYIGLLGLLLSSLCLTVVTFMASYDNYPGGHALQRLHLLGEVENDQNETWVHIDSFSAMNGVSRFCENDSPWRYSKEEGIPLGELCRRNFTYLVNEHKEVNGYKCLLAVNGFSRYQILSGFPPISLVQEPKVFIHGNEGIASRRSWPGCL